MLSYIDQAAFAEYLQEVQQKKYEEPSWRMGQTFFNVLYNLHPDAANALRARRFDPFYDDTRIAAFLVQVLELL